MSGCCVVILISFLALTSPGFARSVPAQEQPQTIIELWVTGDDGVTQRFREGYEANLESAGFVLAMGEQARATNTTKTAAAKLHRRRSNKALQLTAR